MTKIILYIYIYIHIHIYIILTIHNIVVQQREQEWYNNIVLLKLLMLRLFPFSKVSDFIYVLYQIPSTLFYST